MKYGVNAALLMAAPGSREVVPSGQYGGDVVRVQDRYVVESGDEIGTVVKLGRLRKGQRMIEVRVSTDGLGTNCTFKVGTQKVDGSSDNDARFISATAFATANTILRTNVHAGFDYEATEDLDVIGTFAGANPTAGKLISACCLVGRK